MNDAPDGRYLEPHGVLAAADAAVALIVDESDNYLVQLRDSKRTIFFPDHWGCFGGALDPGETNEVCLARELREELSLDIAQLSWRHFTTFTFDFGFAGGGVIHRTYYEVLLTQQSLDHIELGEGRAMALFSGPELLEKCVTPYDRFAVWMHCYRSKLSAGNASITAS